MGDAVPMIDDLKFPGHGYPEREAELRRGADATTWARLTQNQPTGGRAVILYDADAEEPQIAATPFLDLGGADQDATQMQIVIDQPRVIWHRASTLAGLDITNLSGEYSNVTVDTTDHFPGDSTPIVWPPISVLIEFGTLTKTQIIVDIINGARINIAASWVRAYAVVTDDAANRPGTSAAYALRAFATPGWPSSSLAQRTVWVGTLTDGAPSSVFAVPAAAKRVALVGCDTSATPPIITSGYIRFWQRPDGPTAMAGNVGNYFVSGNQPGPFVVPNGAAYFDVVSQMGDALTTPFAAVFDLAA